MAEQLWVFREFDGDYQNTGCITSRQNEAVFAYSSEYLQLEEAQSISLSLPLRLDPYSPKETSTFFEGLLPEGDMRRSLEWALHAGPGAFSVLLARLNNESAGALVFSTGSPSDESELIKNRSYTAFSSEDLQLFSNNPGRVALETGMASRLSIAGAQTKLGLYKEDDKSADSWFLPLGSAPSTHIIKASDGRFQYLTINEALCLATARHLGFAVAESFLIPVTDAEPLLAVRRFDRIMRDDSPTIDGHSIPRRLHQEDVCQAAGLPLMYKYEPTDGNYLGFTARLINQHAENPFADRMMLFNRVLFDFIIGNCDNHLKNHSFLWNESWSTRELSPLYDITCTTFYPNLDKEMGVSLCASRRIDKVTADDILLSAIRVGIGEKLAWEQYISLSEDFMQSLAKAEEELLEQGFKEAVVVADFIRVDAEGRLSL